MRLRACSFPPPCATLIRGMAERSPRMLELARALLIASSEGRLQWTPSAKVPGQFEMSIAGSGLSIASPGPEGADPFSLVLWGPQALGEGCNANSEQEWVPLEKLSTDDLI